jgi:hypothetical protein
MSWRGDLVARLLGNADLTDLLGDRIAFFEAARSWGDTFPQMVLQEISPGREYTHDGHDGLDRPRVQFDIYALNGAEIERVEAALLAEMERFDVVQGGTRFGYGFLEDRDMRSTSETADGTRVQGMSMDFAFFHHTTT